MRNTQAINALAKKVNDQLLQLSMAFEEKGFINKTDEDNVNFNWFEVLAVGRLGMLDEEFHSILSELAGDWPTCACGQLCRKLPRTPGGRPVDFILGNLGIDFSKAVDCKEWETAEGLFERIEDRTNILLLEEKNAND